MGVDLMTNTQSDQPVARPITTAPTFRDTDGVELTTVPGAALLTGMAVRTIYGWIRKGLVDCRFTPTGQTRVVVKSLFKVDKAERTT